MMSIALIWMVSLAIFLKVADQAPLRNDLR